MGRSEAPRSTGRLQARPQGRPHLRVLLGDGAQDPGPSVRVSLRVLLSVESWGKEKRRQSVAPGRMRA